MDELLPLIERTWGFRTLRPLQERAMRAVLEGRDSLVVLPTGGGKSLCYQAPALVHGGTTVVVSPLLALMKDQVDSLRLNNVPAVRIDSSQTPDERRESERLLDEQRVPLVFVSPERLLVPDFCQRLRQIRLKAIAIDETHCISHWGHDFRQEYRQLGKLREMFPGVSIHGYTATATEPVRQDIIAQLRLQNPEVLIGNFDRPNLTYRVLPRHSLAAQVQTVLDRHANEAGIIYCLRRLDVDGLAAQLARQGYNVRAYHAGMTSDERRAAQDAFAKEECNIIVATIAFGMGIDRGNVRFVLHASMPKSLEHYQQETGRAGRDGLEAECVLLHSGADCMTWKSIMEKSALEAGAAPDFLNGAFRHLDDIDRYCRGAVCRHKALVNYFGQELASDNCMACDLCLGDNSPLPDAVVVAQKILSCVARVKERFGIGHVVSVLRGEVNERITKQGHNQLSTYGLLRDRSAVDLRDWIYQLVSQKALVQNEVTLNDGRKVPILGLTPLSWEVMRGQQPVKLLRMVRRKRGEKAAKSAADVSMWEGVDVALFETLRGLRRAIAQEIAKPPYVVFTDDTLREMARQRPTTLEALRKIRGVGEAKLRDYGERFVRAIEGA